MISRFRNDKEIFYGEVRGNRVIVDRGLYNDTFLLQDLSLLPPTIPTKIICVGLNYKDHAKELGMQVPDDPVIFLKPPSAVIGAYGNIVYPDASKNVDYEGELGVIINKRCKNVRASEAISVILGYTCFNDVTARDIQKKETQWTRSKSFDTFAPVGPYIVDPELDISDLAIRTRVNGELRQDSSTAVAKGVTAPSPVITTLLLNVLLILVQRLFSRPKKLPNLIFHHCRPITSSKERHECLF